MVTPRVGQRERSDIALIVIRGESGSRTNLDEIVLQEKTAIQGTNFNYSIVGVRKIRRKSSSNRDF
jgi:hypothetical protein